MVNLTNTNLISYFDDFMHEDLGQLLYHTKINHKAVNT